MRYLIRDGVRDFVLLQVLAMSKGEATVVTGYGMRTVEGTSTKETQRFRVRRGRDASRRTRIHFILDAATSQINTRLRTVIHH